MSPREALAAWRRAGPVKGTHTALRMLAATARTPVRRMRLRTRPLRVGRRDLYDALGQTAGQALAGPVLAALPDVRAWALALDAGLGDDERHLLIDRAERICAHRFDLLGSGPTELGPEIDWLTDFKSGRRWPLVHISRVVVSYPDHSDIKVPWELSRGQHLPLLAAAHRLTGQARYCDEIVAQLRSWIAANPVEQGPNWQCTMDVAIRAANWVAALALLGPAAERGPWLEEVLASLLLHGRFIRTHLEWGEVRGNHYLSDVVGLLAVAALFSRSAEGRGWAEWTTGQIAAELKHQVRPDGCDHEASTSYHRLVAELFVAGIAAADALCPGRIFGADRMRLECMLDFTAAYTRPDGLAPQIGDADDGRFLPLDDYARADPRDHRHLLRRAGRPPNSSTKSVAFPDGGYWIMRAGELYAIIRCGDNGLGGLGGHAHNDQLSFELSLGDQPLVVDPGAFVYTADPDARNLFRSTGFHGTVRIGGAEQNPLRDDYLFTLSDRTRAECLRFEASSDRVLFEGCHHGYEALDPPATHTRMFELDGVASHLLVRDLVIGEGTQELEWTFPLIPDAMADADGARAIVKTPRARMEIAAEGLDLTVERGWYSPSYGRREPAPFVRARRPGRPGSDVTELRLSVTRT